MEARENRTTCGPMFRDALEQYTNDAPGYRGVFAAGFISGQAEKVYLGACQAAMFRPERKDRRMVANILTDVATRYGLLTHYLEENDEGEFWLCRDMDAVRLVRSLASTKRNSYGWHALRAQLCGVPLEEVDTEFHERRGYGEKCD